MRPSQPGPRKRGGVGLRCVEERTPISTLHWTMADSTGFSGKIQAIDIVELFYGHSDAQTLFKRHGETGNHAVSCLHQLRPIGSPLNPMECGIISSPQCRRSDFLVLRSTAIQTPTAGLKYPSPHRAPYQGDVTQGAPYANISLTVGKTAEASAFKPFGRRVASCKRGRGESDPCSLARRCRIVVGGGCHWLALASASARCADASVHGAAFRLGLQQGSGSRRCLGSAISASAAGTRLHRRQRYRVRQRWSFLQQRRPERLCSRMSSLTPCSSTERRAQ